MCRPSSSIPVYSCTASWLHVYTAGMADTDLEYAGRGGARTFRRRPPITSRFLFVDVAAQRAKQLRRGALLRVERQPGGPHKLERLAMEEVRNRRHPVHACRPATTARAYARNFPARPP